MNHPTYSLLGCEVEHVISSIGKHPEVEGILLIGSAAQGALTSSSDVDLVVFTALPPSLQFVATRAASRRIDIIFVYSAVMEQLISWCKRDSTRVERDVEYWLQTGRILCDKNGLLSHSQEALRERTPSTPSASEQSNAISTCLFELRRLRSDALNLGGKIAIVEELRISYGISRLLQHYLTIRRSPWTGARNAIDSVASVDPKFLELLEQCLRQTGCERLATYSLALEKALGPSVQSDKDTQLFVPIRSTSADEQLNEAREFWSALLMPTLRTDDSGRST